MEPSPVSSLMIVSSNVGGASVKGALLEAARAVALLVAANVDSGTGETELFPAIAGRHDHTLQRAHVHLYALAFYL